LTETAEVIPLERLTEETYGSLICYPRYDAEEIKRRVEELERLGVKAIELKGEKKAFNLPVLGKGCVGIVVAAQTEKGKVALKIRRLDADRAGMQREAEMLKKANSVDVGPRLIAVTENFLVMEFIEGMLLPKWIESLRGRGAKARIRRVLQSILEQCWRLDEAGLDHGELSRAPKHVIVDADDNPRILDFETASVARKVSNVTSMCQFLFIGSQIAKTIKRKFGKVNQKELVRTLRSYKQKRMREHFNEILIACNLRRA
jgi:putative serine/threonine protein kinase